MTLKDYIDKFVFRFISFLNVYTINEAQTKLTGLFNIHVIYGKQVLQRKKVFWLIEVWECSIFKCFLGWNVQQKLVTNSFDRNIHQLNTYRSKCIILIFWYSYLNLFDVIPTTHESSFVGNAPLKRQFLSCYSRIMFVIELRYINKQLFYLAVREDGQRYIQVMLANDVSLETMIQLICTNFLQD